MSSLQQQQQWPTIEQVIETLTHEEMIELAAWWTTGVSDRPLRLPLEPLPPIRVPTAAPVAVTTGDDGPFYANADAHARLRGMR